MTIPAQGVAAGGAYRHRQIGWATLIGFGAALATQAAVVTRHWRRGRRLRALLSLAWAASLVTSMGLFSWLDTEVGTDELVVSFAGGALRRRIPLSEIESATIVRVPWYMGWGARLAPRWLRGGGPGGWVYIVWGRDAVELRLPQDRSFTVGSDEPEALLAAVEAARAAKAAGSAA